MNLMGGLTALDEYYKEGDRRKTREYQQALRDAELSTLSDKTEAERADFMDRRSAAQARTQLRPGETQIATTDQGRRLTEAQGAARRVGTVEQTRDVEANTGLSAAQARNQRQPLVNETEYMRATTGLGDAQHALSTQPARQSLADMKLTLDLNTTQADLNMLPERIEKLAVQGVLDQQGQSDVVLGTMAELISRQDKDGVINFANAIAKRGNIFPNTNGKTFTDVRGVRAGENGATGNGYIFTTSDGQEKFVPVEAMASARQKLKSGKYEFRVGRNGEIISGNTSTGQVQVVREGNPALAGNRTNDTAEMRNAKWLIDNQVVKTPQEAWAMVRASKEKTRPAFVQEYILKQAGMGDPRKHAEDAGKLYDELNKPAPAAVAAAAATPAASAPGSNTPVAPTLDPRIPGLIGMPSSPGKP